jgi:methyl halide transferase
MNKFNKDYWNERYENNDTGWDLGAISTPLKEYIDQLTDKKIAILIPGAGNAYEAEYLIQKGFNNITVIDIAEQPLLNIKKRLPDFPTENLILGDFFRHDTSYDLILEQTFFCALDPTLRGKYADQMLKLLKPQGKLAGVFFTEPLNPDKPPFGATKEEYIALFSPLFHIHTIEKCYNSIKPRNGRELFIILQKR